MALAFSIGGFGCAKVDQAPTGAGGTGVDAAQGAAGTGGGAADDGGAGSTSPLDLNFDRPPLAVCGDSVVGFNESCDDGNDVPGDGCSDFCIVEPGFSCPHVGMPCVRNVVCGDHFIEGTEACDDGNTTSGDGCAADCTLECGWECPPGAACRAAKCGDGKVAGTEQCDDGNTTNGDGCSSLCTLESKPVAVAEGWVCTSSTTSGTADGGADGGASAACKGPTKCTTTVCGNGKVEGSEQCDDGNTATGDGCSPFCRLEPVCPATGGACTTACGDGLLLPIDKVNGQECDDGNTVDGDGCSAKCKKEPGFICTDVSSKPDMLVLPIVYHDFKGWNEGDAVHDHPDFQHFQGNGRGFPGIAQPTLGPAGVPLHVAGCFPMPGGGYPALLTANSCASSGTPAPVGPAWDATVDWYGMWYVDNPTFNKTIVSTLTLPPIAGGAFQFSSDLTPPGFFPIDGMGWGNGPNAHNFGFTSVTRTWFEYSGAANLAFFGDDDVWVYINKKLAVDLGGTHQRASGSVTLDAATGHGFVCDFVAPGNAFPSPVCSPTLANGHDVDLGLKIGSVYEIVVFQAERYTDQSNYQLTLSGFTGVKSSCVGACGDGVMTPPEKCDLGAAKNTGAYGGCNADCTLAPYCGDGKVTNGEECEPSMPGCGADCKKIIVN